MSTTVALGVRGASAPRLAERGASAPRLAERIETIIEKPERNDQGYIEVAHEGPA
jgi:hypothetical protein